MTHWPSRHDPKGPQKQRKFLAACKAADHCVAMCAHTARHCPADRTSIWGGAAEARFVKSPIVVGVCAKISRRKCPDRIRQLQQLPGIDVRVTNGRIPAPNMPAWYRGLDYLVVTSDNEGGPYPVLEAIAAGVPVIAPDVGWCWDWPVIRYTDTADLLRVVRQLVQPADPWQAASAQLHEIFARVLTGVPLALPVPAGGTFPFGGQRFPYFYHPHNCGLATARRRTERTVELPIADRWLSQRDSSHVVEIGAVTPYYWPQRVRRVIDPADRRATERESMFAVDFSGRDVLSISTIEHIGERRYGLRETRTPEDAFERIRRDAASFLLTIPYQGRALDKWLVEWRSSLLLENIRVAILNRAADETWSETDRLQPYRRWANTVLVVSREGPQP